MAAPHVLVLPFPAQGHVIPMMELSHSLVEHGVKVTFVNTELNHGLILGALATRDINFGEIDMVSIPDGLCDDESRKDLGRLTDSFLKVMPGELEKLIVRIGAAAQEGEGGVSWLIADVNMAWSFPVAKKLGVRAAGFCPSSAAMFATRIKIPELIRDGVLDEDGWPKRRGAFQLAPAMLLPVMDTAEISWNRAGDPKGQPLIFQLILWNNAATHLAETIICNSLQELEPGAFELPPRRRRGPRRPAPRLRQAGRQLLAAGRVVRAVARRAAGRLVVYVAFGSIASFDAGQHRVLRRPVPEPELRLRRVEDGAGGARAVIAFSRGRGEGRSAEQSGGAARRRGDEGAGARAAGRRPAGHRRGWVVAPQPQTVRGPFTRVSAS